MSGTHRALHHVRHSLVDAVQCLEIACTPANKFKTHCKLVRAGLKVPDGSPQSTLRVHHAYAPPRQVATNHIRKSPM